MALSPLEELKSNVRGLGAIHKDRFHRSRRIFMEERSVALKERREIEYKIRSEVSDFFSVNYASVYFTGSAQIGFSIVKDRLFRPGESDLDIACVDPGLFQRGWQDIISVTRAFTDMTPFGSMKANEVEALKDNILRRGMIRVQIMPKSQLSLRWTQFEDRKTREYRGSFGKVSIAIYMNEYAFCWKQDTALTQLLDR